MNICKFYSFIILALRKALEKKIKLQEGNWLSLPTCLPVLSLVAWPPTLSSSPNRELSAARCCPLLGFTGI